MASFIGGGDPAMTGVAKAMVELSVALGNGEVVRCGVRMSASGPELTVVRTEADAVAVQERGGIVMSVVDRTQEIMELRGRQAKGFSCNLREEIVEHINRTRGGKGEVV
jgi:hypothetical protein